MSENSDAAVVVVSEETGTVSIAVDGHLIRGLSKGDLISKLEQLLIGDSEKSGEGNMQKKLGKIIQINRKDKSEKTKSKENSKSTKRNKNDLD